MMICLLVSFLASLAGSICGIGGVVTKPVLDFLQVVPVSTIGFLSSCTVLAMSCYSVGKMVVSGDAAIKSRTITTLALGSVVGGVLGKQLFSELCGLLGGIAGRSICKKIAQKTVDRMFLVLNVLIIGICIVNFCQAICEEEVYDPYRQHHAQACQWIMQSSV